MFGRITIEVAEKTFHLSEVEAKALRDSLSEQLGIHPQREIVKALTDKIIDTYRPGLESWLRNYLFPLPPMPVIGKMVGEINKTQS